MPDQDPDTNHRGLNGKTGEVLRWAFGLLLAAVVSYFTSIGAVQTRIAVAESQIDAMREDMRELRSDVKLILQAVR